MSTYYQKNKDTGTYDDHHVEDAFHTLTKAEHIKGMGDLMDQVKAHAERQGAAIKKITSVDDLRRAKKEVDARPANYHKIEEKGPRSPKAFKGPGKKLRQDPSNYDADKDDEPSNGD